MKTSHRGMTLLELMAAVAILGILMALSMPGLQGVINDRRISAAQRAIYLETLEARQQARSSRQPVRLAIISSADENGRLVSAVRWEQLDCANAATDPWGSQCPMPACQTAACGTGGCTCTVTGTPVPLPPGLEASSLDGLCWLGGESTRVVARTGTTTCSATNAVPAAGTLRLRKSDPTGTYLVDQVLSVNALTGALRMVDCTSSPGQYGCP
ncbi:pilus assembly FimT family protein [Pyxidicoccus xibeiensis]|uniref:pilus assembly FimT family protein n=1 Tax=Pyxidicoccus xibeiensis TaxID=2906759 RepID=UPI0020A835F0|nr:prepilin-type N-terminal cleavage/methylation domain-containing protein [Pyxidicoccus xibeiensis]MCP3144152.1 prepilin-type N-terminal cleavage/methylation domain-containing protein [Pyxidicoccus xibeiensis]